MNVFSSLIEVRDAIKNRQMTAEQALDLFWRQCQKHNGTIKAFITMVDQAKERARAIDKQIQSGKDPGALAGVPVAIKDMLCTRGTKTTAASKILAQFIPPYSATVVERLEQAGAIVIGKTNQDEFAMGSSSETSHFGKTLNPWNLECVPGGSSGGSAAAVAAGMAPLAIGTDTGGSIRQPANFCGIVGIKPTYGRVSRYGIIAFASSLDQAGPMTRTVRDSALSLEIISGHDPRDATTSEQAVPRWSQQLRQDLKGVRIGLPREYFSAEVSAETQKVIDQSIAIVRDAGAKTVEVSIPLTEMAVPVYYLVATSEASSNLARYDGVRYGYRADFSHQPAADLLEFYSRTRGEGFGSEVKRRIMLGTYALSSGYYDAYYRKAGQVRRLLRDQFMQAFAKCDVLLSPVTTAPAFKVNERISDPLQMYLNDIYTTSANLVGIPGMSVPAGFSQQGLPIGVQLASAHFAEQNIFDVGHVIESGLNLTREVPRGVQ